MWIKPLKRKLDIIQKSIYNTSQAEIENEIHLLCVTCKENREIIVGWFDI